MTGHNAGTDMSTRPTKVLIVDDHEIFLQSLVRLLADEPSIEVVGTATSAAAVEQAVMAYEPDVILMDFELPDSDGATATEAVKALLPTTKVVMLTGRTDRDALVRAIAAGCSGFVAKTEGVEKLVSAIGSAHAGETQLLGDRRPSHGGPGTDLGDREVEVLRLVAAGMPNRAIAHQLHISLNTVRNQVQNVLNKLRVHSKLEAVAVAVREGVIARETATPAVDQPGSATPTR
jgi:DNA-binding NarL/FixJ family response regulator